MKLFFFMNLVMFLSGTWLWGNILPSAPIEGVYLGIAWTFAFLGMSFLGLYGILSEKRERLLDPPPEERN